jgi:curved DNA-binding protein CbpA
MTRSLYAILNVSPDADPAVIEAAYKALMKKFHPDMVIGEPEGTQRKAAEINRAYQILRNPERRAEYDAGEQARQEAMRMPGPDTRPPSFQPLPPQRSKWPALFLIAVLAALTFFVWRMTAGTERQQFASAVPAAAQRKGGGDDATSLPPVSQTNIDRAIAESQRINRRTGLMGLSGFSQDCFASQSRSARAEELDFCVAFDSAAMTYDAESARMYSLPELPRFQPREMLSRHLSAGNLVSEDEEWVRGRLAQIRSLTAARMNILTAPPPVRRAPAPAAIASARPEAPRTSSRRTEAAPRARAKPPAPRTRQRRSDAEFMERQGYIY